MRALAVIAALIAVSAPAQYQAPKTRIPDGARFEGSVTYEDTFWDDSQSPAMSLYGNPAANPASVVLFTNTAGAVNVGLEFDPGDKAYGSVQMSHKYKLNTDMEPHIHWTAVTTGTVWWTATYTYAGLRGELTNAVYRSVSATCTQGNHYCYADFDPLPAGDMNESGYIGFMIQVTNVVPAGFKPLLLFTDLHFQIDKPGSNNEIP